MAETKIKLTQEDIQALRCGDKDVFRAIFLEFQPRLYRFLWLKLRSVEIAEDLVQETFLRLWQARKRLNRESNLEIYLFRIASNLATDFLRKAKRQKPVQSIDEEHTLASQSSESAPEYRQLAQIIDDTICFLPDRPRTAFLLSRYEELPHKEIAEVMGISIKTVEKHIGKALLILKKRLEKLDLVNNL
ncbi:MAG: RNA polymerase sigma factor [bacterium]